MRKINHFGIPTLEKQANEIYLEGMKLYVTDFAKSENKIEFLRFEPDSWLPDIIQQVAHIAYEVSDLEKELEGANVIVEPIVGDDMTMAFIVEEGIPIELMYFHRK